MNDLLDHKLKKLDHQIKYNYVSFDEEKMKKAVLASQKANNKRSRSWVLRTAPIPLVAVLSLICFQLAFPSSSTETHLASLSPVKSNVTEMKTSIYAEPKMLSTKASDQTTLTKGKSTMVRETYVLHNNSEFVQTGRTVDPSQLNEVIGTVKIDRLANEPLLQETKIYSIKGENTEEFIAIQSRRNTGIGSTSISKQGYFVFEHRKPLPAAQ